MSRRGTKSLGTVSLLVAALLGACAAGEASPTSSETSGANAEPTPTQSEPEPTEPPSSENGLSLPEREGPRRQTSGSVPHVQLDAELVPEVDSELRRRVFQLPGIADRPSDRSLPGARGLAFTGELGLARADVIAGSREFAHIHPDGSLHVWLSVESAAEVERQKWGEVHPWADREGFWPGVVMVFTPETMEELDITLQIVVDAYNYVTGAALTPADIA